MDRLDRLRRALQGLATMCVFLEHKRGPDSDDRLPIALSAVAPAIRQSTGCEVSAADLALLRGLLGGGVLELEQLPDDGGLGFLLHPPPPPPPVAVQARKRRRTERPGPVQLVAGILAAFSAGADELRRRQQREQRSLDDLLAELAAANMPSAAAPAAEPSAPLTASAFLASLQQASFYSGQIVGNATRSIAAAPARFAEPTVDIDQRVWAALASRGVQRLFTHQAAALDHILGGPGGTVVATATASGKSAMFQAATLQLLLDDPDARVLLVFPTKALAQDQAAAMAALLAAAPALAHLQACVLDGDTPGQQDGSNERRRIRRTASVVLTNPDTLHQAILPNAAWAPFWARLALVVLDELHVYQGPFGQHMALILARLRRLCTPRFAAFSATTANPADHMRALTHEPAIAVVDADGAPRGPWDLVLWDTAISPKKHPQSDVVLVAAHMLQCGLRGIVFCKQRQTCELVLRELLDCLEPELQHTVASYRGGYTPAERRAIEQRLFGGELRLVIATSALELGVDVGGLDVVLMLGMPVSAASLWQQAGRAGRQQQPSLAMVLATGAPLDRALVADPTQLFVRPLPPAHIASDPAVARAHLHCAAFERPLAPGEPMLDGAGGDHGLVWDRPTDRWCCSLALKPWPPLKVPIRGAHRADWLVVATASHRLLEELDERHALLALYEGGILMHQGSSYSIDRIDPDHRLALVTPAHVSWFTRPRDRQTATPARTDASAELSSAATLCYGTIDLRITVFGYRRIDTRTKRVVEIVDHASPALTATTVGLWIDMPAAVARLLATEHGTEASIHAAQHALIAAVSRAAGCSPADLATECKSPLATVPRPPRLVVYETAPAAAIAAGPTRRSLAAPEALVHDALRRITDCQCSDGCSACVHMASCREHNQCISKPGALRLLQGLLLPAKDVEKARRLG
ncbi:ATP-dependent 3'-5' DNA helicase [Coemansia spiralis]|nr:ATP-dependent 3'-5' DNA helicase [Coemansia spiralis]